MPRSGVAEFIPPARASALPLLDHMTPLFTHAKSLWTVHTWVAPRVKPVAYFTCCDDPLNLTPACPFCALAMKSGLAVWTNALLLTRSSQFALTTVPLFGASSATQYASC